MEYKYDVAISYRSEIEGRAAKIADYLEADGWNVFYAPMKQQELVSEKLHQKLYSVYKNEAALKLLLISDNYLAGEWTSLEKRVSMESTKQDRARLVVVNYTKNLLAKDLAEVVYLDGTKLHEDEIAAFVTERLQRDSQQDKSGKKRMEGVGRQVNIQVNKGIIAGDNAQFGDIHF